MNRQTDETPLRLLEDELIIDVRKDRCGGEVWITAEAIPKTTLGVNLLIHGARSQPAEEVIEALRAGLDHLGVHARRLRVVREDLPPQTVLQFYDGVRGVEETPGGVEAAPGSRTNGDAPDLYPDGDEPA